MNNQEKFKQTFEQIHAPEALLGKVMDMQMEKKEFKARNFVKVAMCVFALGLGLFGAGNGICYAATGETLITKMKVVINGEEMQQDVEWTQQGDAYHGEAVIPSEDGSSVTVFTVSDDIPENMDVRLEISKDEKADEDGIAEEKVVEVAIMEEGATPDTIGVSITDETEKAGVSSNSTEDMDVSE